MNIQHTLVVLKGLASLRVRPEQAALASLGATVNLKLLTMNGKQLVSALTALTALQVCVNRKSRWCWWCP